MDGPKHRRLIVLGLAILAGGALLLIGRPPPTPAPNPVSATMTITNRQVDLNQPVKVDSPIFESAASPVEPPLASAPQHGFRGRVIDAVSRQPIKEFEVQLIRIRREAHTEDQPINRNFKSATGHFAWTDVAAGTWRATVSAPGYQMFNVDAWQITEGEATSEIVMPLLRGFAVRGRVVESSTGAGISGAGISFRQLHAMESYGRSHARAKSNQDGSFTLDGIPGGDIVLRVSAANHAYRELTIVVDEETPPQQIALSTGATIAGIVTTIAGLPVKGRVALMAGTTSYIHETNDAGQFSFNHMPPGSYRVSADTSAGSATQELTLVQDEVKQDINLIVGAGRSVRGTIRGGGAQTEQPQKAHIHLRSQSGARFNARPDERRAYTFKGVPAGPAVITVFTENLQFQKEVDVPAGRDITVDIVLPTGARLSGRVTQVGKPAANRTLWMSPADRASELVYRARTSQDGQYEIEGLPAGDYRMRVDGDISRAIAIAGDAVLNIDIPMTQLSARVVEDGGSIPVVGANIYVRGSTAETARVSANEQTDDFGQVALTGIEFGEIVLIVYQPGYELYRETIAYSAPISNKTITLRKSAGVEVRIQPGSRRFPRGFTITQSVPGSDYVVDLWVPKDGEGMGHVPSALAGTTFQIGRFSGEPIVIEAWDGQPFELP